MKKRRKIFIISIFLTTFIIVSFAALAKYQLEQFNDAYLNEEIEEIEALGNQIAWAVRPYLKDNNYVELDKYSNTFNNSDTSICIRNSKGQVVAGNNTSEITLFDTEKTFIEGDIVYHIEPILINEERYTLLVFTTTKHVVSTLSKLDRAVLISIILGFCVIILFGIYLINLYRTFNQIQNSAVKISAGNLDADIFIPHGGILYELACALNKMSKRLKSQIEDLKQFDNFRSEFIAGVSHELKTPITAILSAIETIEDLRGSDNNCDKCFKIIKKQSERINTLIQGILSIHELERRKIENKTDFMELNLARIIEESVSLCSISDIKLKLDLKNVIIAGDSGLLEQAIINLLVNAMKYSKSDKIDITLDSKDNAAIISVKDYGIGIPEEHLPHIFEHFYRVDKARSRNLGGSGLGLAIVKNIITLHNGTIEVKSNNGCEFIITLPLL